MGMASSVARLRRRSRAISSRQTRLGAGFAPRAGLWFARTRRCCLEGTLTDATIPGPLPPPPPRSHGCLWGCLAAAIIAIVAIVGVASYTGWYFTSGFKNDVTLHAVMNVVNGDQIARAVLGDNIQIT